VVEAAGEVWAAVDSGAYRFDAGSFRPVLDGLQVNVIAEVAGGEVWIGSVGGLFRVEGDTSVPLYEQEIGTRTITAIKHVGEIVLVGTSGGLFQITPQESASTTTEVTSLVHAVETISDREWVHAVETTSDQVWVGTSHNAYRSSGPQGPFARLFEEAADVVEIAEAGDYVWLVTQAAYDRYRKVYRLTSTGPSESAPTIFYPSPEGLYPEYEIVSVKNFRGNFWLATTTGVLELKEGAEAGGHAVGFEEPAILSPTGQLIEPVNTMASLFADAELWIGTTRGIYRLEDNVFSSIDLPAQPPGEFIRGSHNVKGITLIREAVWLWTASDVIYRLDTSGRASDSSSRRLYWLIGFAILAAVVAAGVSLVRWLVNRSTKETGSPAPPP
jgi:ligand-binding sensor domain-containing protein